VPSIAVKLYENPRLLLLCVALITAAGWAALATLPRIEDPVLTRRVGLVTTVFPGANSRHVEAQVTEPLELALASVAEIKNLHSISRPGFSAIIVTLRDDVVGAAPAWSRVRDRVASAAGMLPDAARRPDVEELPLKAYAVILALRWTREPPANFAILRRLAAQLRDRVQALPGTELVALHGDPGEEVVVEVEPATASALGLSPGEIAQQLLARDVTTSGGRLHRGPSDLPLEVSSSLDSLDQLRRAPIRFGRDGRSVNLADVAEIRRGAVDPRPRLALVDDLPAIAVAAFVRDDVRLDHWTRRLQSELVEYESALPAGVELDYVFAQNRYVESRMHHLLANLLLGLAAVVVVVLLLMGWRSTLVVGLALPLSALMVLAGMRVLQMPIDQMSITGLIIALGLLIDNAIVIVDEVRGRYWSGLPATTAISQGIRHLAMPLFGSTLTTTLAFAPIALMPGPAGEFVRGIAVSVMLAINASFLLAMTVVPALTVLLQPRATDRPTLLRYGLTSRWLSGLYARSLDMAFRHPIAGVSLGMILPLLGFAAASTLPEQFFPPAQRDQLQIEIDMHASTTLAGTESVVREVSDVVRQHASVRRLHWFLGESAPTFYYNVVPRRRNSPSYAQALVELQPGTDSRSLIHTLQTELDQRFATCRPLVRQLEQGPPFDAPVELQLYGPDLATLQQLGRELRRLLAEDGRVLHTRSDLEESLPRLSLAVDDRAAGLAGLSQAAIARQLYVMLEGASAGALRDGTTELPIRVRWSQPRQPDPRAWLELPAPPPSHGGPTAAGLAAQANPSAPQLPPAPGEAAPSAVPLGLLGRLALDSDVAAISRRGGRRTNEIKAYITAGTLPAEVLVDFRQRLARSPFSLPPGYRLDFGGEAAERNDAVGNLLADVGLLVVVMLAVLVISFGSFRAAMIVAAVGGLAMGLGVGSLWCFGFPFGFMAIIGTMGLVGVAINDAIVVTAGIQADPRAVAGDRRAIRDVVMHCTRHVMTTSLTTMAGFAPLVIAGGGFWPPLAVAIAGGVGGATILALYFVPASHLLLGGCRAGAADNANPSNSPLQSGTSAGISN